MDRYKYTLKRLIPKISILKDMQTIAVLPLSNLTNVTLTANTGKIKSEIA